MQDLEQSIRERAYHLWMESGCLDGNAEAHWLAAQREVLIASVSTFVRVPEAEQPASLQPAFLKKSTKSRKGLVAPQSYGSRSSMIGPISSRL